MKTTVMHSFTFLNNLLVGREGDESNITVVSDWKSTVSLTHEISFTRGGNGNHHMSRFYFPKFEGGSDFTGQQVL